ncbi:MAG: hypothetical protein CVV52_03605 [Spirochaetae bacterium HGW-Spirochaetae-8]|jgi:hypothetical protein|nr:MAG: hypothetical protein CVV52_03605 [Spirochaetae bacterium HGW-Spirochaetae-8]
MKKLRMAHVAVLFIMILVMILVDCEMVRPAHTTNFKFKFKSQAPEPASKSFIAVGSLECTDYRVLSEKAWDA